MNKKGTLGNVITGFSALVLIFIIIAAYIGFSFGARALLPNEVNLNLGSLRHSDNFLFEEIELEKEEVVRRKSLGKEEETRIEKTKMSIFDAFVFSWKDESYLDDFDRALREVVREDLEQGNCLVLVRLDDSEPGYFISAGRTDLPGLESQEYLSIDNEAFADELPEEYASSLSRFTILGDREISVGVYSGECLR